MACFRKRDCVAEGQLESVLAELARLGDDDALRREVLDKASHSMLNRPALGGQLIARFCATEETAPELEILSELLGSVLDAARMATENRKKRGAVFLQTAAEAVELAAGQNRIPPVHRMLLASAWARNGLPGPAALELADENLEESGFTRSTANRAEADAKLDELLSSLIVQTEGEAVALHATLTETFPAMPADVREHVVRLSAERPEPIYAKLVCFWLVDRDATIRAAAAGALADRAATGALSRELAGKIVALRNWMPPDEARGMLDQAVKLALRSGLTAGDRLNRAGFAGG